jgi:hypothetical protein
MVVLRHLKSSDDLQKNFGSVLEMGRWHGCNPDVSFLGVGFTQNLITPLFSPDLGISLKKRTLLGLDYKD